MANGVIQNKISVSTLHFIIIVLVYYAESFRTQCDLHITKEARDGSTQVDSLALTDGGSSAQREHAEREAEAP